MSIQVKLNGELSSLPEGANLADAVAELTGLASGVAAAVNGNVVPRGSWAATPLGDGDQVEVVTAVQGGLDDRYRCAPPGRPARPRFARPARPRFARPARPRFARPG